MLEMFIRVEWPEIQYYMDHPNYKEDCYFDSSKNSWFVPEEWISWLENKLDYEKFVETEEPLNYL